MTLISLLFASCSRYVLNVLWLVGSELSSPASASSPALIALALDEYVPTDLTLPSKR